MYLRKGGVCTPGSEAAGWTHHPVLAHWVAAHAWGTTPGPSRCRRSLCKPFNCRTSCSCYGHACLVSRERHVAGAPAQHAVQHAVQHAWHPLVVDVSDAVRDQEAVGLAANFRGGGVGQGVAVVALQGDQGPQERAVQWEGEGKGRSGTQSGDGGGVLPHAWQYLAWPWIVAYEQDLGFTCIGQPSAFCQPAGSRSPLTGEVPHSTSCMRQWLLAVLALVPDTTQVALNCRAGEFSGLSLQDARGGFTIVRIHHSFIRA